MKDTLGIIYAAEDDVDIREFTKNVLLQHCPLEQGTGLLTSHYPIW